MPGSIRSNWWYAAHVLMGDFGTGAARREALEKAGANYQEVQKIVNSLLADTVETLFANDSKYLKVSIDLSKYDGIELNFKEA